MSGKLEERHIFYKSYLGFIDIFVREWHVRLSHPEGGELMLIDASHGTIPMACRSVVKGMILNIKVGDALLYTLQKLNYRKLVMDLRIEEHGQRHFMIQEPNNLLIDVIEKFYLVKLFKRIMSQEEMNLEK